MAKSRSFSIFLLKEGYDASNALKEDHSLGDAVDDASALPDNATLFILESSPTQPWWKGYWGIQQDLFQMMKGALVFLPVNNRCFAITFGHTSHNLKDDCYEYDFGLLTTLNAIDPNKLKSTDILQPENAKRERIQSPTASDLTFFDINNDESIFKKLTGVVREEYKDIFTNTTGSSSLRLNSKVTSDKISDLCSLLLEIYSKDDYKENFPDIQNIVPVKDPAIISTLNQKLLDAFHEEPKELYLSIPEIMEHSDAYQIKYTGAGKSELHDDVYLLHYRNYLKLNGRVSIDINDLKAHKLVVQDENGVDKKSFSIFKCLLFNCDESSKAYHLCEGEWYQINTDFINKLKTELDPYFVDLEMLSACNVKREDAYNDSIAANNSDIVCLDKKNIAPEKQTPVEPCDLYYVKDDIAQLVHIKISTRSSSLSHLFNQGLNSAELLRSEEQSINKLKELLQKDDLYQPVEKGDFAVVYGIITAKDKSKKSDNLPIFSRISLRRCVYSYKRMKIKCSVILIEDKFDRKGIDND